MEFKQRKITKEELFLLKDYASIDQQQLKELYIEFGEPTMDERNLFLQYFLLIGGVLLSLSGLVFFFAFNWDNLSSYSKFVTVIIGIVLSAFFSISKKYKPLVNHLGLFAASVLIGVLLAVFGQVYQTGANAYDLFLTWTLVVVPLTLVSKSSYQWLGLSVLVNVTILLYFMQIKTSISFYSKLDIFFLTNILLFILPKVKLGKEQFTIAALYLQIQLIFIYIISLIGVWNIIFYFSSYYYLSFDFIIFSIVLLSLLLGGLYLAMRNKDIYLFTYVILTVCVSVLMFLINLLEDSATAFLLYMIYVLLTMYFIIKQIIVFKKKWNHEG